MDVRKILIILIVVICIFALGYGVYYQVFKRNEPDISTKNNVGVTTDTDTIEFDEIFDNKINYQGYNVNNQIKIDQTKDLVYTNYTKTEIFEEKYDIKANIPIININSEKIANINKEINSIFQEKVSSIEANKTSSVVAPTIYTVDYTAYLNENILSIVIRSTLKEGNNAQRLIIMAYTYNLSTNELIPLTNMLTIKGKEAQTVQQEIRKEIRQSISQTDNLAALGYTVYERDMTNAMYDVENSNSYLLGPNGTIYIIYAYGNTSYTSEKDIVVIK